MPSRESVPGQCGYILCTMSHASALIECNVCLVSHPAKIDEQVSGLARPRRDDE